MTDTIISLPGTDSNPGPHDPSNPGGSSGPSTQHQPGPHEPARPHTANTNGHDMHYSKWREYFPVAAVFYELAPVLSYEELVSMAALGVFIAGPPAVKGVAGAFMGLMEYGPIFNTAALEILANEAMLSAFTRAGVLGALKPGTTSIYQFSGHLLFKFQDRSIAVSKATKRSLESMGVDGVVKEAIRKGVNTPYSGCLLWSGYGAKGVQISQEFAAKAGYTTLEMTPGGAWLERLNLYGKHSPFTEKQNTYIWEKVSEAMIAKASGQVSSVVGYISPGSVYNLELKAIQNNPRISGVDELKLLPRIFFSTGP